MSDRLPEIYCDIMLVFPDDCENISKYFEGTDIIPSRPGRYGKAPLGRWIIAKTDYLKEWYLDEALAVLFKKVDAVFPQIIDLMKDHDAKAIINIAFWQFGTYPALSITGKNMEYIRLLHANIDIDPYDSS